MIHSPARGKPLRIACVGFALNEVDALRSLLGLLAPYVKRPCLVVDEIDADLTLVNLDAVPRRPAAGSVPARVVGCALRPRDHDKGTIYRPLRASQVLAVLSDAATSGGGEPADERTILWRFRLHGWPLDFSALPHRWWRIYASMADEARSVAEISAHTELAAGEVERAIDLLTHRGLIERTADRIVSANRAQPRRGWRDLVNRVGQMLGFRQ